MSAGASVVLGLYNFTLPRTSVKDKGKKTGFKDVIGLDALKLAKEPNFAVFWGACLLIGIPIQMYFAFFNMFLNDIGVENVARNDARPSLGSGVHGVRSLDDRPRWVKVDDDLGASLLVDPLLSFRRNISRRGIFDSFFDPHSWRLLRLLQCHGIDLRRFEGRGATVLRLKACLCSFSWE